MRDFLRLTWKEMRELLRPQYILPLVFIPLVFVALGQGLGGFSEALEDQPRIGIVNNDRDELGNLTAEAMAANAEVIHRSTGDTPAAALETVRAEGGEALIVIPRDFTETLRSGGRAPLRVFAIVEQASLFGIVSSSKIAGLIQTADTQLTLELTGASPAQLDPTTSEYTTYLKGKRLAIAPTQISTLFSTRFLFIPIIIMLVIIVSGQMVINSMGIEKENKTLETLLTMPVRRRTLVAAKLVGSTAIGLGGAALYTVALAYYGSSFSGLGGQSGGDPVLSLGGLDYALVGVSLFLALVGVLALALCLGLFASGRQGAQMLLLPISVLAMVPMFMTMFTDFTTLGTPLQAVLFAIPFTHPIIAPKQLLFDNVGIVLAGIGYEVAFAAGTVWLAIRLFDSDRLVTGTTGRFGRVLSYLQR